MASATASGEVGTELAQRRGGYRRLLQHERRASNSLMRVLPGEGEPGGDAERVEVRARVAAVTARLLRAEVERGTHRDALGGRRRARAAGDPEVGHDGAPRVALDEDVVGLDVAVHDAARVRMAERPRDLLDDARDFLDRGVGRAAAHVRRASHLPRSPSRRRRGRRPHRRGGSGRCADAKVRRRVAPRAGSVRDTRGARRAAAGGA